MAKIEKQTTRKRISDSVEIPEGITAELDGKTLILSKGSERLERKLEFEAKKQDNKIILECERPTKNIKKLIKSSIAHINNMVSGLGKKYIYKLQICAVHFPMNVAVKGQEVVIKNFLGEVKERKAQIIPGVAVKIDKEIITVESSNKEKTGQTAANIESATRITNRDRRIFQDGIYIIEKEKGVRK